MELNSQLDSQNVSQEFLSKYGIFKLIKFKLPKNTS
jgi:hypothetical protein